MEEENDVTPEYESPKIKKELPAADPEIIAHKAAEPIERDYSSVYNIMVENIERSFSMAQDEIDRKNNAKLTSDFAKLTKTTVDKLKAFEAKIKSAKEGKK